MDPLQSELTQSAHQMNGTAEKKKRFLTIVLFCIAAVMFLAIASLAAYFFVIPVKNKVDEVLIVRKIPSDLRSAIFITRSKPDGKNVFAQSNGFFIVPNKSETVQPPTGSVSPSGELYTYAETVVRGKTSRLPQAEVVTIPEWSVYVAGAKGKPVPIAQGYAPAFLDETHLIYFASGGLVVYGLQSKNSMLLSRLVATSTMGALVRYSPDRRLVLWTDPLTHQSVLARVSLARYDIIHSFGRFASPVLTNAYIYDVRESPNGSDLWRYELDGSGVTKILTFPASMNIRTFFQ